MIFSFFSFFYILLKFKTKYIMLRKEISIKNNCKNVLQLWHHDNIDSHTYVYIPQLQRCIMTRLNFVVAKNMRRVKSNNLRHSL